MYRVTVYYRNAHGHPHMFECVLNAASHADAACIAWGAVQSRQTGCILRVATATRR